MFCLFRIVLFVTSVFWGAKFQFHGGREGKESTETAVIFFGKFHGQKSPLQHADIQRRSDAFFESSERGQKKASLFRSK